MRIAIDVMGADKTPRAIIYGGLDAARQGKDRFEVLFVGDEKVIEEVFHDDFVGNIPSNVSIEHAPDCIPMDEHSPAAAVKKMKKASIVVATNLQKQGKADAVVSAGSTGAAMAAAFFKLGRLQGVSRPAICALFPTQKAVPCAVLDVGANSDSKPLHLLEFAIMGSIYSQKVLGTENPTVALLNIGEEPTKGNELAVNTYNLFEQKKGINFIGNIEGRDILKGKADVVVCDGFVGNIVLKLTESVYSMLRTTFKKRILSSFRAKIGAYLLNPVFIEVAKELDYAEYGGAPLLGINGVSIICHGSSSSKAIKNAVFAAEKFIANRVNHRIKEEIHKYHLD
jgi:phosphate acyltransferase